MENRRWKLCLVPKVKDRSVAQALKDIMGKTQAQNEMQLTREIRSNKKFLIGLVVSDSLSNGKAY